MLKSNRKNKEDEKLPEEIAENEREEIIKSLFFNYSRMLQNRL